MAAKIETQCFYAIPPAPRHSITTHMPGWDLLLRFVERDMTIMTAFKSFYPRMMVHPDIKSIVGVLLQKYGKEGQHCLIFSTLESATQCRAYALSSLRKDDVLKEEDISIRIFDIDVRLYVVFFPQPKTPIVSGFWNNAGVGISSRLGEDNFKHIDLLREVTDDSPPPKTVMSPAHALIQERIAGLLERSPVAPLRKAKVSPDDVYLFQTGMSSIYRVHQLLLSHFNGSTILFGFAFHSTIHVFEDWEGPGFKLFGLGTPEDTDALEVYLEAETQENRKVQAVWAEFPSNPLLITPDLVRIRKLADKYGFVLIIDDTIGSFSNVDLLSVADIIVTSLTKSFSGYADVMGASAVLNPSSPKYSELKPLFQKHYTNDVYNGDAEVLESNSRNYLERSVLLNKNAEVLVSYLQTLTQDPKSSMKKVYYTTTHPSRSNYETFMRPATTEFTPGYGCLFTMEFDTIEAMRAFYETINLHIGPHLGAHLTLVMPYVKALYGKELDKMAAFDLRETQLRIATGLEPTEELLGVFKEALEAADKVKVGDADAVVV